METVFAFAFSGVCGLLMAVLVFAGVCLRKKHKTLSFASFVFAGIFFLPVAFFIFTLATGIVGGGKFKSEYAAENGKLFAELEYGNRKSILREVSKTDDLNVFDKNGETPLTIACQKCCIYVVDAMASKGADTNLKNAGGSSPLHFAVSGINADSSIVECLVKNGADVDCQDKDGNTPLMLFVMNGSHSENIADILLAAGCDTSLRNMKGENVSDIIHGMIEEERILHENHQSPEPNLEDNPSYKFYKTLLEKIDAPK